MVGIVIKMAKNSGILALGCFERDADLLNHLEYRSCFVGWSIQLELVWFVKPTITEMHIQICVQAAVLFKFRTADGHSLHLYVLPKG